MGSLKVIYKKPLKTFESVEFESKVYNVMTLGDTIKKKTNGFIRMIRPTNLLPTLTIGLSSGFIMKQNILQLLRSPSFISANIIVLLIMSNSMILNDIYDVPIDRYNNPDRPLIKGELTIKESIFMSLFLFIASEILNKKIIPPYLRHIPHLSNVLILTYTPILKRIPFIKNLSCAVLVASTVLFTGLSSLNNNILITNKNFVLLTFATQLIFTGSLHNEMLSDISDMRGDKKNRIYTIPLLLGEVETIKIIANITFTSILWAVVNLSCFTNIYQGILLALFCFPFFNNILRIIDSNYSDLSIKKSIKRSTIPMVLCLIQLCLLSLPSRR
jgi:4-hydroxybenzoate polyprenyltransferase